MSSLIKKGKSWLKLRYQEGINYFVNFIKPIPSDQVRLLIFGQGRTGSTLLESLLCSTGYFRRNGELLNTSKGEILYPLQYIRGLSKRKAHENFIFHVKIYQLTQDRKHPIDPAVFLNALYEDGWKIIYLRRRNKIKHALSNVVAEYTGNYHKFSDDKNELNVVVNCDNFVERVNQRFRFEDAEKEALGNIKYHEVVYEDDLDKADTHQKTVDRILDYISLEHRVTTTKHKKVNTQSLQDLISNYDEFIDCLTKQEWQGFLEY
ncbi:MAG: hypothetical protein QNJ63_14785 [Calothrix sp. MO_192.B10]|nr:hypothetical protein [Calothrix sp. MO_192.B10]